jgi:hypothetical protein
VRNSIDLAFSSDRIPHSSFLVSENFFFRSRKKIIASPFHGFYLARHPSGIAFALPGARELAHEVASWSNGSPASPHDEAIVPVKEHEQARTG